MDVSDSGFVYVSFCRLLSRKKFYFNIAFAYVAKFVI